MWRYVCREWRELEGWNIEGRKNMDRNDGGVVVEIDSSTYVRMYVCWGVMYPVVLFFALGAKAGQE